MVISKLIGGLGNQMFQYAAGRALALRNNVQFGLDISGFEHYELHQGFELQRVFVHSSYIVSNADVKAVLGWNQLPRIRRLLKHLPFKIWTLQRLIVEPSFEYWAGINQVPRDCYLDGYWQSEKYFNDCAATIRADFQFRRPLAGQDSDLASVIGQGNAVSLHIRRGDYVSDSKANAFHGLCSMDYYHKAVRYLAERVERPHFYIFSDDIVWARENINIEFPCEFIGHNQGEKSYVDMQLMSLCAHHIIANSSFSWWGAWLNPSTTKIVVAPDKWFRIDKRVDDLLPQGWVRL